MELGLSYDDVLLVPKKSNVSSRKDISTDTFLTKKIKLKIPIISSNMDTVTESSMAIAMAQLGGIGLIHRFNTIQQQCEQVVKVKRHRNAIIENPITIRPTFTLKEARQAMEKYNVTSLLILDNENKLTGILTSRDIRFRPPEHTIVTKLMTPKEKIIFAKPGITIEEAKKILVENKIEKLPIINSDFTLAGLITGKDIYNKSKYPYATVDEKDRLCVGAAIGVKSDSIERAQALINAGADILVIDIAHGHSELAITTLRAVKSRFPEAQVIAGNIATPEGARDLIEAGADCIKVGVGPGSICTTRIVTGAGYPQLSAIMNSAKEAQKFEIPVIADGGIKLSGDITKAIAAGASSVMLGSLLAGTDESPGHPIIKNGKKFKVVRGMASFGAKLGRDEKENNHADDIFDFVPEGVEATVSYKGSVVEVISQLIGGLRSGMSYCGARRIEELHKNAEFIRITSSGLKESHAHDVNLV